MDDKNEITDIMIQEELKNIPKLYGTTEFGNAIGWYCQKVCIYNSRDLLPKPAAIIGNRPFWSYLQVVKYAQDKNIKIKVENM